MVGGVAAALNGCERPTRDLDVVYRRSDDSYRKLVESLSDFKPYLRGAPPGLPFKFDAETIRRGLNFTLTTEVGDIDLLVQIAGGDYESLKDHTFTIEVFGVEAQCLDIKTLIRVKRAAGRPKDFEAIAELERIADEELGA